MHYSYVIFMAGGVVECHKSRNTQKTFIISLSVMLGPEKLEPAISLQSPILSFDFDVIVTKLSVFNPA